MKSRYNEERIDTTLGELIEAVSEVAFEYSNDTQEAYTMARLALVEILRNGYPIREQGRMAGPGFSKGDHPH